MRYYAIRTGQRISIENNTVIYVHNDYVGAIEWFGFGLLLVENWRFFQQFTFETPKTVGEHKQAEKQHEIFV